MVPIMAQAARRRGPPSTPVSQPPCGMASPVIVATRIHVGTLQSMLDEREGDRLAAVLRAERSQAGAHASRAEMMDVTKRYAREIAELKTRLAEKDAQLMGGFGSLDMMVHGELPLPPLAALGSKPPVGIPVHDRRQPGSPSLLRQFAPFGDFAPGIGHPLPERSGSADSLTHPHRSPSHNLRDAVTASQQHGPGHHSVGGGVRSVTENGHSVGGTARSVTDHGFNGVSTSPGADGMPGSPMARPRPSIRSANAVPGSGAPGRDESSLAVTQRISSGSLPALPRPSSNLKGPTPKSLDLEGDAGRGDGAAKTGTGKKKVKKGVKSVKAAGEAVDVEDYQGPGPGEEDDALGDEPFDEEGLRREVMESIPAPVARKSVKKKAAVS
ncbi:MAG: hypothetical protein WDW38_001750 [Sanguina aurantia]